MDLNVTSTAMDILNLKMMPIWLWHGMEVIGQTLEPLSNVSMVTTHLLSSSQFHFCIKSYLAETYFDVLKPTSVISLYKSCNPDPSNDSKTGWFYTHPVIESLQKQLPACVKICPEDPPEENEDISRSWIENYLSVGASATFKCRDHSKQFYLKYLYKTITMICTDTEIGTVWIWKDQEGKDQTTLPECKVRL